MDSGIEILYRLVKKTRNSVFSYCENLPFEIYTKMQGDWSIQKLHLHIANCYLFWVGEVGLKKPLDRTRNSTNITDIKSLFTKVDTVLDEAFATFDDLDKIFVWEEPKYPPANINQRWLLMHPITHEFHHKGQILMLGRLFGYPADSKLDFDLATL